MTKRADLAGQQFGKLTVIEYSYTEKPRGVAYWLCVCECGEYTTVQTGHLRSGHTQSCGCFHREQVRESSMGNTWGRKHDNPQIASSKHMWECSYSDGCSYDKFMELSQLPCHYCCIAPFTIFNKYINKEGKLTNPNVTIEWAEKAYFTYNGLDRVDPSKGHTEDNIVPCCWPCNRAKGDMTYDEFKVWRKLIAEHYYREHTKENDQQQVLVIS